MQRYDCAPVHLLETEKRLSTRGPTHSYGVTPPGGKGDTYNATSGISLLFWPPGWTQPHGKPDEFEYHTLHEEIFFLSGTMHFDKWYSVKSPGYINHPPMWKHPTNFASILDGTSNTLMIGEKYVRPDMRWGRNEDRSIYNGQFARVFRRAAGAPTLVTNPPAAPFPLVSNIGDAWIGTTPIRETFQRFGSWHPGVCQFVMTDGSVRIVQNNISYSTLGRLAERSDALPISSF